MKRLMWIFAFALLTNAQMASVEGREACDPCDPCAMNNPCDLCDIDFCDISYEVYVDALYWQVCKGDLNFGDDDDEKYLNPDYDWGFRLAGMARWKNWDLGVRWTSFCTEHSRSVDDDKIKWDFDYDVVDIEVGFTCCLDCGPISVRPFAGAKLAWIDDHFDKEELGGSDSKIDFEGYGLYLGCSSRWELCSFCSCDRNIPVALVTRASTGILHSEWSQDVDNGGGDRKDECVYVPVHDLYVGLDLTFCDLCGWDAFVQVGYEVQYWGWREYNDDEDITHLGLGGLVLRFGASF